MTDYADSCESCLSRGRTVAAPALAVPDGDGGLIAAYRCPTCGHTWTCSWHPDTAPENPAPARARKHLSRGDTA